MASDYGQKFQSLQIFLQIDALATVHGQMLTARRIHTADQLGDMLHKLGKGQYPWLLPMGPDPAMGVWLNELAKREREEQRLTAHIGSA